MLAMDLTQQLDLTTTETVRETSQCPMGPGKCEIRDSVARNHAQCAIAALQVDINMKMQHAMNVHGLTRDEAKKFVIGCYLTANVRTFARDGLIALGTLVGELSSNV